MEDPQQMTTAEPRPSKALTPPDGKSMVSTQQENPPDASVANPNVSAVPSTASGKTPMRKGLPQRFIGGLRNFMRSFIVGLRKLGILLWKTSLLRIRAFILLGFEIFFTAVLLFVTLYPGPLSKEGTGGVITKAETPPEEFDQTDMIASFRSRFARKEMLYVPAEPGDPSGTAHNILDKVNEQFAQPLQHIIWIPVAKESDVEARFNRMFAQQVGMDFEGAIIFEKLDKVRGLVKYKIRMTKDEGTLQTSGLNAGTTIYVTSKTSALFSSTNEPGPNEVHQKAYKDAGILGLQLLIDDNAVKEFYGTTGFNQKVILKSFPYPKYKKITESTSSDQFATFVGWLSWELMKLCGYAGWMQSLAWYMVSLVIDLVPIIIIIVGLMCYPLYDKINKKNVTYIENSDFTLWLVVMVLSQISINSFIMLLNSLIKSTTVATAIVVILDYFGIGGIGAVYKFAKKQTFGLYFGLSFIPYGNMLNAFKFLYYFEQVENGATWSVIDRPLPNVPNFNMGYVILMFFVDIVLYHSLAVYFGAILPSNYGIRKPAHYPFLPIIRLIQSLVKRKGKKKIDPTVTANHMNRVQESKATGFEPYQGLSTTIGVDVQNLVKKFDKNKMAVNGVSLKMYDGEIFALLGHNGAGKTTLISMLTGMFAPTSGTARVGGYDITTDMDRVRQSLGLCPQHDMLFKNLTVMEHLQIFGAMKGKSCSKVKQEAKSLLMMMRLADKANVVSRKLSGGQKRKLCLGMALIGEAKVVILDEPTSGMDPEARRAIWDILLQIRGQRTVLLTTHYMEEADVLGDRIGIMAEGKMQCCGSPTYLKSFYGTGYTLKASLFPGADKYAILSLVQKHISDASFKPINMPTEVFIALPTETATPPVLASLFSDLTKRKDEMRIESLGLSVASMDEIFVKVGELSGKAAVEEHMVDLLQSNPSVPGPTQDHDQHHHHKKKHKPQDQEPQSEIVGESPSTGVTAVEGSVLPSVAKEGVVGQSPSAQTGIPPNPKATTQTCMKIIKYSSAASKMKSNIYLNILLFSSMIFRYALIVKSRRRILRVLNLILMQAWAIFIKRFLITRRKIWFLIFEIIFPALCMLAIVLGASDTYAPDPLPPPLEMTLDSYKHPVTYYFSEDPGFIDKAKEAIRPIAKHTSDVKSALERIGESDINSFRDNYIVAGEIKANEYIAWFNTIPLHAAPLALNLASNIRGRDLSPHPPIKFQVTHYPLQTKDALLIQAALRMDGMGFLIALIMMLVMMMSLPTIAVCFITLPIEERLNKSRQLQLMTGMHPLLYWLVNFMWDLVIILISGIIMITIAAICQTYQVFSLYDGLGVIFLLFLAYGYVVIPLAYLFSNLPGSVSGGVILLEVALSVPILLSLFLLFLLVKTPEAFGWMARICPIIGMSLSFYYVGTALGKNGKCGFVRALGKSGKDIVCSSQVSSGSPIAKLTPCCENCNDLPGVMCYKPDAFITWTRPAILEGTFPGIGQILLCFFVMSIICQTLHLLIQLGGLRFLRGLMIRARSSDFVDNVMDEDVQQEKQRVAQMIATRQTGQDAFVVTNISKNYCTLAAVSKLTFGVHHGECFGLLGTNGAGKTTTFRIITGDEVPSMGDAFKNMFSLNSNRRKLISNIGYCPQFDAFIPYLTGRENVQMFARLRGVPCKQVNVLVDQLLARVGLTDSRNVLCRKYSGGMKRRLSAAIALVGDPSVLLLDEPTSGVDPVSRRQFWKILESVKASGKSIILTSHSMDECEALCSRLGIMVNGELQCIGGVQHLKHKFAQGYCLTLRLKPSPMSDIQPPFQQQPAPQQPQFKQLQNPFPQQQQFQQPQLQQFQPQQQQFQQQPPQFQQHPQQFQPQQQQFQPQQQQFQPQQQQYQQPQQQSQFQFQQPPQQQFQFQQQNAMAGQLEGLNKEITEKFHPCVLKDQHETVLQYQIENTALGWDVIYKTLEDLKKSYADIIEDYSVSETSLEEVFLAFSRRQYPPRTAKVPTWKRVLTCQC